MTLLLEEVVLVEVGDDAWLKTGRTGVSCVLFIVMILHEGDDSFNGFRDVSKQVPSNERTVTFEGGFDVRVFFGNKGFGEQSSLSFVPIAKVDRKHVE